MLRLSWAQLPRQADTTACYGISKPQIPPEKIEAPLPIFPICVATPAWSTSRSPPVEPLGLPGGVRVEMLV